MTRYTGGCLCGRVHYSVEATPAFTGICHCRNCQRATGSSFEPVLAFPSDAVTVTGDLKSYQDTSDAGRPVHRKFCPECGSRVAVEVAAMPGMTLLLAGTLDDPSTFQPAVEIFCASAQPWVSLAGDRPRFPGMPPPPQ